MRLFPHDTSLTLIVSFVEPLEKVCIFCIFVIFIHAYFEFITITDNGKYKTQNTNIKLFESVKKYCFTLILDSAQNQ